MKSPFYQWLKSLMKGVWPILLACQAFAQTSYLHLSSTGAKRIKQQTSVTQNDARISLSIQDKIAGLGLSGSVKLNNENGFARIILQDKSGREFLVYEANSLSFDGLSGTFERSAEETRTLINASPAALRVELSEATLRLTEVVYLPAGAPAAFRLESDDSLRYRQAQEKANQLNAQIRKKGLHWQAGVTSVSLMSFEQKKLLFRGTIPNLQGAEYYTGGILTLGTPKASAAGGSSQGSTVAPKASPYVASFDWRKRHGQFWPSPVSNQASCGSCGIFSSTASTEQLVNLYYNRHLNINLAEQDPLSCIGWGDCTGGWSPSDILDYYKTNGVVNESCFPYTATQSACAGKCGSPQERIKIGGREDFNSSTGTEDQLKALIIKGPVIGGLRSWGHAMNLIGYKVCQAGDTITNNTDHSYSILQAGDPLIGQTVWLFKNSWGTTYGQKGYMNVIQPIEDFWWTHGAYGPVTSQNYTTASILCTDNDHDGYYFWGVGQKPAHCPVSPALPDGDDSNPLLGPMNQYGYCTPIGGYTLSTSAVNGSVTLNPAGPTYASGTVVTVTAVPNAGYAFSSWSGALSGTVNPTTITMNANKSVTAGFTAAPVTCQLNDAAPVASQWVIRNDWNDQTSGSQLVSESGALKVVHRAYGQNLLWVINNTNFPVVSGQNYTVKFDFKDFAGSPVSGVEVGLRNSIYQTGPQLVQPAVIVPAGFSSSSFTTKTVSFTATSSGSYGIAFKLKWSSQPTLQVSDFIKNITVCKTAPGSTNRSELVNSEDFSGTELLLAPNPAEQVLMISGAFGTGLEVEVYDLTGTNVLSENVTLSPGEHAYQLNIQHLDKGMYSIRLKSDGISQTRKFIKQ